MPTVPRGNTNIPTINGSGKDRGRDRRRCDAVTHAASIKGAASPLSV
jgi:hypothetical protein